MYHDKLVVAVKHNGRVLRENGDAVLIPFGSEYTLYFKNLNSVKASVRVSIDGQDATKDVSLVIEPNDSIELERFLDASNMDRGHRFKFIGRTKKIEDGPRGIGVEDGLIRVEFEFAQPPAKIEPIERIIIDRHWTYPVYPYPYPYPSPIWYSNSTTYSSTDASSVSTTPAGASSQASIKTSALRGIGADAPGITVPGSISEQKFNLTSGFITDGQVHVMVLRLMGQVGESLVEKPITVKTKTKCPTCGTLNKHGTKFCRECGTGLTLL